MIPYDICRIYALRLVSLRYIDRRSSHTLGLVWLGVGGHLLGHDHCTLLFSVCSFGLKIWVIDPCSKNLPVNTDLAQCFPGTLFSQLLQIQTQMMILCCRLRI